jgi:hypothetical protein
MPARGVLTPVLVREASCPPFSHARLTWPRGGTLEQA